MVSATFQNDLGERSRRWVLLKRIYGCVPSVRRDSTSPTSMRNKRTDHLARGIRETLYKTCHLRLQISKRYTTAISTRSALQASRVIRITEPLSSQNWRRLLSLSPHLYFAYCDAT